MTAYSNPFPTFIQSKGGVEAVKDSLTNHPYNAGLPLKQIITRTKKPDNLKGDLESRL